MRLRIEFASILFIIILNVSIGQNCFVCQDTPLDTSDRPTVLKSRYHLIQLFGNFSYNTTLYYDKAYKGDLEWVETRILFPYFSEIFKQKIALPDIYVTAIFKDLKDLYWEQRLDYGFGIEWRPLKFIKEPLTPFNWLKHLRVYMVRLMGYYYYCKKRTTDLDDYRIGIELYRECSLYSDYDPENVKGNRCFLWSEFWGDVSYRTTNFTVNNFRVC